MTSESSHKETVEMSSVEFPAWRIIPVSKWLVTPIYKPFRPFIRGITPFRGLTNHGYQPLTNWDGPPSG